MKATISQEAFSGDCQNAINYGSKKELVEAYSGVVAGVNTLDGRAMMEEPIKVRFYMGRSNRASVVYCSLWIHKKGLRASGRGKAGGYGYDKFSASFEAAAESAGITFADYKGQVEVENGVMAIMEAMGYDYNYTKMVTNHR